MLTPTPILILLLLILTLTLTLSTPFNLTQTLQTLVDTHSLLGLQLQLTKSNTILYNANLGSRDTHSPITNTTMFGVASLSKSVTAAALMLLVEEGKLRLSWGIGGLLGFQVGNPGFPGVEITVEMLLSHQSSLVQCEPYYSNFLLATKQAQTGPQIPLLSQLLLPTGKFHHPCLFSPAGPPGKIFSYVNLNYGIAGTIIEKVSGIRFDIFVRERILRYVSEGLEEIATFDVGAIRDVGNLGAAFLGRDGVWVPGNDYFPDGRIPMRNLTGYKIGSNGLVFSPQGGLRASVSHLSNYLYILTHNGLTKSSTRILSPASILELLKPRYQYHGPASRSGTYPSFNLYGFGLYTTSYRTEDNVIRHETVHGHIGEDYGLIAGFYFWRDYAFSYVVNGALFGYRWGNGTIYEVERVGVHQAIERYVRELELSEGKRQF